MNKVAIATNTSGTVRHEMLNGRTHLVTNMRPIVGDIVMNGGLYPDAEVTKSFNQLDQLPAPCGHPKVAGQNISAFHPLAVNSHNIGAFIRNPVKQEKEVYTELWIDETIANQSDDGQEVIKRLNAGTPIGVSTGLQLERQTVNEEGLDYSWIGSNYKFDHVAILLNELPAGGDQTVTINEDEELEVHVLEANEFSISNLKDSISSMLKAGRTENDPWPYIVDVFVEGEDGGYLIYELQDQYFKRTFSAENMGANVTLGEPQPVERVVTYTELNGGDASTQQTNQTQEPEMDKSNEGGVTNGEFTIEDAVNLLESKGFKVVNTADAQNEDLKFFLENKDSIMQLVENQQAELVDLRAKVLEANEELTEDEVNGMSVNLLKKLAPTPTATVNHALAAGNAGKVTAINGAVEIPDYTPKYDGVEGGAS